MCSRQRLWGWRRSSRLTLENWRPPSSKPTGRPFFLFLISLFPQGVCFVQHFDFFCFLKAFVSATFDFLRFVICLFVQLFNFFFVPSRRLFCATFWIFTFCQGAAFVQYFDFITLGVLASITDRWLFPPMIVTYWPLCYLMLIGKSVIFFSLILLEIVFIITMFINKFLAFCL